MSSGMNPQMVIHSADAPAVPRPSGQSSQTSSKINRRDFPSDFVFGVGTSALQVEGAYATDGRGLSNWDVFTLETPGNISDGSNACVAIDQYHRYQEDVKLMKRFGLDAYRFSISWSRLLPGGRPSTGINHDGIRYYNNLIDFCLAQGIEPYITLFHFDLPQRLEDEYGGFLSPRILKDFVEFAQLCFLHFGDRVKHWITINESYMFTYAGYVGGIFPPGRGARNSAADPSTEPYIVAHHLILAHALAADLYRNNFQMVQGGKIGISPVSRWFDPLTDTDADKEAVSRALDFMLGWFMGPLATGDYPPVMRELVGNRLPEFTQEEKELVKGSYDFIGLNYYTSNYAANAPNQPGTPPNYDTDQKVAFSTERDGIPIGPKAATVWQYIVPYGLYMLLVYIKEKYNDPVIYITENGVSEANNKSLTIPEVLVDETRIKFYEDHLFYTMKAIADGVNVKAFFMWSMFDNFELTDGYTVRFGLFYVDYTNNLTRYPKKSAIWLMNFLNKNLVDGTKRQLEESDEYDSQENTKLVTN